MKSSGFTLIELLLVIVLVGTLSAVALPSFLDFRNGADYISITVASRKTHTGAGDFDVPIVAGGLGAVEFRTGGSYSIIFTFPRTISAAGTASLIQGTATVGAVSIGPNTNQITVALTGVTDRQWLQLSLTGVLTAGTVPVTPVEARWKILFGDVDGNGFVDAADTRSVQLKTMQPVTSSTFNRDVNADGNIDSGDLISVRAREGNVFVN